MVRLIVMISSEGWIEHGFDRDHYTGNHRKQNHQNQSKQIGRQAHAQTTDGGL